MAKLSPVHVYLSLLKFALIASSILNFGYQ